MSIPVTVGTVTETSVHLRLRVSFLIVKHVVPQGQCIRENSMTQTAVTQVQPWPARSVWSSERLCRSVREPVAM